MKTKIVVTLTLLENVVAYLVVGFFVGLNIPLGSLWIVVLAMSAAAALETIFYRKLVIISSGDDLEDYTLFLEKILHACAFFLTGYMLGRLYVYEML